MNHAHCPFIIGDSVTFDPTPRTSGLHQDIERFGVRIGESLLIAEIREDTYLYFDGGAGGWPWNEFRLSEGQGPARTYVALLESVQQPERAIKVAVLARSLEQAKWLLQRQHGSQRVLSLWNETDAKAPR
jgi:hypothetical protein